MTEKVKRLDWMEVAKLLGVTLTTIAGTQAIDASGNQSTEAKIAVLEEKVGSIEKALPKIVSTIEKIDDKQDTILLTLARMQK